MNCSRISWFMVTRDVLKVVQIVLAYGSCNFENFQNITRTHKSGNALSFIQFPILIVHDQVLWTFIFIAIILFYPDYPDYTYRRLSKFLNSTSEIFKMGTTKLSETRRDWHRLYYATEKP